jgi:phosphoglycolate phosphatase-like HAD superfamily hydrolase
MHQIFNYDIYIFDCDGVILDSNALKVQAMKDSLYSLSFSSAIVSRCADYFSKNFGKSRFHHVKYFLDEIINTQNIDKEDIGSKILACYSEKCRKLYMEADITPGFLEFISSLNGCKYIASGSEQNELREVFKKRGLDKLFNNIYGSPISKDEIVSNILSKYNITNAIMFGDAISDFNAAVNNNIEFIAYLPYSNVSVEMQRNCDMGGYRFINSWLDLK